MSLEESCQKAHSLLKRIEQSLDEHDPEHIKVKATFAELRFVIDSPLFTRLLKVQNSLEQLGSISRERAPIVDSQFDINPSDGQLLLDPNREEQRKGLSHNDVRVNGLRETGDRVKYDIQAEFARSLDRAANGRPIEVITLYKTEGSNFGFGIVVHGETDGDGVQGGEVGVFVRDIQPGLIAAKDGRLRENDQILAIDEVLLESSRASDLRRRATELLKVSSGSVELIVSRSVSQQSSAAVASPHLQAAEVSVHQPSSPYQSRINMAESDWIHIEVIDLVNDGTGLGFGIVGSKGAGVLVKTILPGSVSDRDGRLRSGDYIVQIGDINVRGMISEQVALVLRQLGVDVRLIVARPVPHFFRTDSPLAVVVPGVQLDEELDRINRRLEADRGSRTSLISGQLSHMATAHGFVRAGEPFEVELTKDSQGLGITIAGYADTDGNPRMFVSGITEGSVVKKDGRIKLGDYILAVDNQSLEGHTNDQAIDVLRSTGHVVRLKVVRAVDAAPTFSHNRIPVEDVARNESVGYWQSIMGDDYTIVMADLKKFKEGGGLGISLEGTVTVDTAAGVETQRHHFIGSILPEGPIGLDGRLEKGDELLEVNGNHLLGLEHLGVVAILKELPLNVRLVCARRKTPLQLTERWVERPSFSGAENMGSNLGLGGALVKAKSEQTLFPSPAPLSQPVVENGEEDGSVGHGGVGKGGGAESSLNKKKSRSLEPLGRLTLWATEPTVVELSKDDKGLGFSILDYPDPLDPSVTMILIQSLVPGGVAQADGRLVPGDRLVLVNDIKLYNATLDQAVQALKGAPRGVVKIGVVKPMDSSVSQTADGDSATTNQLSPLKMTPLSSVPTTDQSMASNNEQTIKIVKGTGPIGLAIETAENQSNGCVVTAIDPAGALNKDGRIEVGDYIVAVNNESLRHVTSPQARAIVRRASLVGSEISITYLRSTRQNNMSGDISATDSLSSDPQMSIISLTPPAPPPASPPHETPSTLEPIYSTPLPRAKPITSPKTSPRRHPVEDESFVLKPLSPLSLSSLMIAPVNALPEAVVSERAEFPQSAASAWGPQRLVELVRREGESLGISIVGGTVGLSSSSADPQSLISGIFIKHVLPASPAGRCGLLRQGDRILEVDGVDLRGTSHDNAVEVIRKATSPVRFLVQSLIGETELNQNDSITDKEGDDEAVKTLSETDWDKKRKLYGDLNGELLVVEVERDSSGLGLSLAGNRHLDTMSVFVIGVQAGSVIERTGAIWVGDELLEVNEHVLYGRSHLNASAIIKSINSQHLQFVILRRKDFEDHIAVPPRTPSPRPSLNSPPLLAPPSPVTPNGAILGNTLTVSTIGGGVGGEKREENGGRRRSSGGSVQVLSMRKGTQGLGFAIEEVPSAEGGSDKAITILVRSITSDSPAAKDGRLSVGDQLLAVNNTSLDGLSYQEVLTILRNIPNESVVNLTINKSPQIDLLESPSSDNSSDHRLPGSRQHSPRKTTSPTTSPRSPNKPPVAPKPSSPPVIFHSLREPDPIQEDPATCPITAGRETFIEITKGKSGLGLSLIGGADTMLGAIIIHEIYEGGAAARDGRLWAGDQILEVNGVDLRDATHDHALQTLRTTPSTVKITIYREDASLLASTDGADDDIYETISVTLNKKPGRGLGFSIVGRTNEPRVGGAGGQGGGVFISDFVKNGVAELDNRLLQCDHIITINGTDVRHASQEYVAEILKTCTGSVSIVVSRLKVGTLPRRPSGSGHRKQTSELKPWPSKENLLSDELLPYAITTRGGYTHLTDKTRVPERDPSGGPMGYDRLKTASPPVVPRSQPPPVSPRSDSLAPHTDLSASRRSYLELVSGNSNSERSSLAVPSERNSAVLSTIPSNSSAADEGNNLAGDVKIIHLKKTPAGFGFSIVGGFGSPSGDLPIYIKTVFEGGMAAVDGRLKRGDQLMSVNNQSLAGMTHDQAVAVLKESQGTVVLKVLG